MGFMQTFCSLGWMLGYFGEPVVNFFKYFPALWEFKIGEIWSDDKIIFFGCIFIDYKCNQWIRIWQDVLG